MPNLIHRLKWTEKIIVTVLILIIVLEGTSLSNILTYSAIFLILYKKENYTDYFDLSIITFIIAALFYSFIPNASVHSNGSLLSSSLANISVIFLVMAFTARIFDIALKIKETQNSEPLPN